jgi:HNH endonuclease
MKASLFRVYNTLKFGPQIRIALGRNRLAPVSAPVSIQYSDTGWREHVRYWWVNQGKTSREELAGGYLWSPKRESNGARSQFYNNMRLAAPGDRVLSFVDSHIGHVGTVIDFAEDAEKPTEFSEKGAYWALHGWQLPVFWQRLPQRVKPKPLIAEFRQWLPPKYFPIHPESGNGSEKAYLCEVRPELFEFIVTRGGGAMPLEGSESTWATANASDNATDLGPDDNTSLQGSVREQLIQARAGQGLFRRRVAEIERGCRLTGISNPTLLTASHIKPWRACASTFERLDGFNGILLAPNADRLFDRGLITFEDDGQVRVSPRLDVDDLERLGLAFVCKSGVGAFRYEQRPYLAYHRTLFLR